ncbi:MAG: COX15/CtaA family protein [Phycisphaeraceae bacterium]|nr:COX15/CtaA family protein [Phycisphaeraceae bacterium]
MTDRNNSRAVRCITSLLAVVTFILITTGGLVTSRGAGLAVPDWPTSFGKWLIIPLRLWADAGVALEHNHRITGAVSGLIAIAALIAVGRRFGWKHRLTLLAGLILVLYIVQGVLGGIRVTNKSIPLAIVHGIHGQIVLGLTVVLSTLVRPRKVNPGGRGIVTAWVLVAVVLVQLGLGATLRHTQAASAIPDAPLVFGKLLPPTSQEKVDQLFHEYLGERFRVYIEEPALPMEAVEADHTPNLLENAPTRPATPSSVGMVWLQWVHRVIGMLLIPVLVVVLGYRLSGWRQEGKSLPQGSLLLGLVALLLLQVLLGLSVIWSVKRWEIATGHQAVGALILAVAVAIAVGLQFAPGNPRNPNLRNATAP